MKIFAMALSLLLFPLPALAMSMNEAAARMAAEMDEQLSMQFGHQPGYAGGLSLIVTTPVDINNFENSNAAARQMQESLSHYLVRAGYGVQEVRKGRALLFRPDTGELLLTREESLAAYKHVKSALTLVGNYAITAKSVIFNVRIMRTGGTEVYAMSSLSIPMSGELRSLIHQTADRHSGQGSYLAIEPSVYNRLP